MTTCSVQAIATHTHPTLALMGSGSGSRTAGSGSNSSSGSSPPIKTEPVQSPSTSTSSGPVSPNVRRTPPVGLLNTCNLVQDEKLVVATLATLNSGDPSNIIKQDLRLIIQSRRKAEGKGELTVDFKTPPKDELTEEEEERARKRRDQNRLAAQRFRLKQRKLSSTLSEQQLTSEELEKRARRRELNRLAAKRSREKGQRRKDSLLQEIHSLQTHNVELECARTSLVEEKASLVQTLKVHVPHCHDPVAVARSAQLLAVSQRLTQLLDCPSPRLSALPAAPVPFADPPSLPASQVPGDESGDTCVASPATSAAEDLPRQTPPSPLPSVQVSALPLHGTPHMVVAYSPLPSRTASHARPALRPSSLVASSPVPPPFHPSLGPPSPRSPSPSLAAYPPAQTAGPRGVSAGGRPGGQGEPATPGGDARPSRGLEMDVAVAASLREEFQRRYPFRVVRSTQVRPAPRSPSPSSTPTASHLGGAESSAPHIVPSFPQHALRSSFQLASPTSPLPPYPLASTPHAYHAHASLTLGVSTPAEQDSAGGVVMDSDAVDRNCVSVPLTFSPLAPPSAVGLASEMATFGDLHLHSPHLSGRGRERDLRESQDRSEFYLRGGGMVGGGERGPATLSSSSSSAGLSGSHFPSSHFPSRSEGSSSSSSVMKDNAAASQFRRGPVQRVASFHGTSLLSPTGEQLAPLNLSKRRNSEDWGPMMAAGERFEAEAGFSGLHTWPGASWTTKREHADGGLDPEGDYDSDLPLNLVYREQPPWGSALERGGAHSGREPGPLNLVKRESVDVSGFQDDDDDDIAFASTSRKLTRYSSRDEVG